MLPYHKLLIIEDIRKVWVKYAVDVNFLLLLNFVLFFIVVESINFGNNICSFIVWDMFSGRFLMHIKGTIFVNLVIIHSHFQI